MAIRIDQSLLKELGLDDLPQEEKAKLLKQFRETLELRVGTQIAGALKPEQLEEFEKFMDKQDEKGAMIWLEKNYPDYPKAVSTELARLKEEIKSDADKIKKSVG